MTLVWRVCTVADPCAPPGHRIPSPLAERAGQECRILTRAPRGSNGNVLIVFADGFEVIAPGWFVGAATQPARQETLAL